MSRFLDLTDAIPRLGPGQFDFSNPDRLFPTAVAESRLRIWAPGDPIPTHGTRVLLGVATWSGYDMRLLDVIDPALAERSDDAPVVDVFNAGRLTSVQDFENYISGLEAHHTPVLGIWQDGRLVERKYGYHAHDRVARMFGTCADEIVDYVQSRIAARAQ